MLWFRKFLLAKKFCIRRGREKGLSKFSVKKLLSQSAKNFVRKPFSLSLLSGVEKIYASEGYATSFRRNVLSNSTETFRRGTRNRSVLCSRKFPVAKKFM